MSAVGPAGPPAPDARPATSGAARRRRAVLLGLALGGAALAVGTTTWVRGVTSSAVAAEVELAVPGTVVAPGAGAGGLVVAAASLALALGGRWGRRFAAAGIALGGLLVAASAVAALADPQAAALSAAQDAVGVAALVEPASSTPMPWLAAVLGAAATVLGVALLVARGWAPPSTRHESPQVGGVAEPGARSDGSAAAPADQVAKTGSVSDRPPDAAVDDDHAAWDALSRGEDPT